MHSDDDVPANKKKDRIDTSATLDNIADSKKSDKKDSEDPKPRIVLTFRSDKSGAKTSNMKIVSTEEKNDEKSPRRSNRHRQAKWESDDDDETLSPKKDKILSEGEDASDSSRSRHSTRRRGKESDIIANAIARKEKSYNESATTSTRLSRRIKPTAKILANEELRMGLESQNNARLGLTEKSPEGGVRTRRSAQKNNKKVKPSKHEDSGGDDDSDNSEMKLKHLCELGLKSVDQNKTDEENVEFEERESDDENEEEIDDDTEVIVKLLEADEESGSASSGDYYIGTKGTSKGARPRRLRRSCTYYGLTERSSPIPVDDENLASKRRSARKKNSRHDDDVERGHSAKRQRVLSSGAEDAPSDHEEEYSNSAGGDEGPEAASPEGTSAVYAKCLCDEMTNFHAAPSELTEPVFCQAIESVDGMRVGCSHKAQRGEGGGLAALRRAGVRAPYMLLCRQHAAQLVQHMCCPACGLFCTQGIFYQCSSGHLFHLECGVPFHESRQPAGCPHCGVHAYPWRALNKDCCKVHLTMHCSNKRVYFPDQREQCTPAFLGFSTVAESQLDTSPIIPEDLLPSLPDLDLTTLRRPDSAVDDVRLHELYETIVAGGTTQQLLDKMVHGEILNRPLSEISGGTCVHAAASGGRLNAVYLLQYAGADLDAVDSCSRTPLVTAILALLEKENPEESVEVKQEPPEESVEVKQELPEEISVECKQEPAGEQDVDNTKENVTMENENLEESKGEIKVDNREGLMKVIRYLIAAGCELNIQGAEGMTALHVAAQLGGDSVCEALLQSGRAVVDAVDHGHWSPLVRAAERGHSTTVRLLLKHGADAASSDSEGNSAVHWCALAGDCAALQLVLDAAPHLIDAPNAHTDTPLHIAAREAHYGCVVVLLARGARTDIENSGGELAADVCDGDCHNAVSVNMQMCAAARGSGARPRCRLLASDISKGREPYPVSCVNEVDDTLLPDDFVYVSRNVMTQNIDIDCTVGTQQGCTCTDATCGGGGGECSCCVLSVRRWYQAGRLPASFPHHEPPMLFECDQTCACDMKRCQNRVVGRVQERGSVGVRVQVYRTERRGWGLRALQPVRRGALLAVYCGELLPHDAADAREKDHYMFELDLKPDLLEECGEKGQLCVDAAQYGSAARFVNHSCRANCAPVRVFTGARDLRLPSVALFATADIRPFDEITFDYGDKFWSVKSKWMRCECGTMECRYTKICNDDGES